MATRREGRPFELNPESLFMKLTDQQVAAVQGAFGAQPLPADHPAMSELENVFDAHSFYVLEQGRVRVQRGHDEQQIVLAELGAGDCFGEMAIIECANRSASIVAVESCTALRVPLAALEHVMDRDYEQFTLIQMNLARELSRRLREADRQLFEARVNVDAMATLLEQPHWYVV